MTTFPTSQTTFASQLTAIRDTLAESRRRVETGRQTTSTDYAARREIATLEKRSGAIDGARNGLSRASTAVSEAKAAAAATAADIAGIRTLLASAKDPNADLAAIQAGISALSANLKSGAAASSILSGTAGSASWSASETGSFAIGADKAATLLASRTGTSGILDAAFDLSALSSGNVAAPSASGLSGTGTATAGVSSVLPGTGGLSGAPSATTGLAVSVPPTDGLSGTATSVDGTDGAIPSVSGLSGAGTVVAGVSGTAATGAKAMLGTLSSSGYGSGDTIVLKVSVDGAATRDVVLRTRSISGSASMKSALQAAADTAFGSGVLVADVAADGKISLVTVATGAGKTISVAAPVGTDGDDLTTSALGLSAQAAPGATAMSFGGRTYTYDSLGVFSGTGIDRKDRLSFQVDGTVGGSAVSKRLEISLSGVSDANTLVAALEAKIAEDPSLSSRIGAAVLNGEVGIYVKSAYSTADRIGVTSIAAVQGDGTVGGSLGLVSGSGTGAGVGSGTAASASAGTTFSGPTVVATGASITFDLTVNGTSRSVAITKSIVEAALSGIGARTAGTGAIADADQFALVAARALSDANVSGVAVSQSGGRLKFTRTGTPTTGDSVAVSAVTAVRGSPTSAVAVTGSAMTSPTTIAPNASIGFVLTVDGASTAVEITKADVESALAGRAGRVDGSGTIADATELAVVVSGVLARAGMTNVSVSSDNGRLRFQRTAGAGSISVGGVEGRSSATKATLSFGSAFAGAVVVQRDATLGFDLSVDGGASVRVAIDADVVETALAGVSGRTAGTGRIADAQQLSLVVTEALSRAGVSGVEVASDGPFLSLVKSVAGAGSLAVSDVSSTASTAVAASFRTGSDFSGPVDFDESASVRFEVEVDGASRSVTIDRALVKQVLGTGLGRVSGRISTADELARVVAAGLDSAGVTGVAVAADGARLTLTKTTAGTGSVSIGAVVASSGIDPQDSGTSVDTIDLGGERFAGLGEASRAAVVDVLLSNLDAVAAGVDRAAASLAFTAGLVDIQKKYKDGVAAAVRARIGGLVEVDLDAEQAKAVALETRDRLLRQSIEIAASSAGSVSSLFG